MSQNSTVVANTKRLHQPIMITIDLDFFVWNGVMAKKNIRYNRNGKRINSRDILSWGSNPLLSAQEIHTRWLRRYARARDVGIDIYKEVDTRADRGCIYPDTCFDLLAEKLQSANLQPEIVRSACHHFAFFIARNLWKENNSNPIKIIHFDAHHDLGYNNEVILRESQHGLMTSGSWLYHSIRHGLCDQVDIVYPDWVEFYEWNKYRNLKHIRSIRDNINIYTWTQWLDLNPDLNNRVHYLHIARSDD